MAELEKTLQKFGEEIYKNAQAHQTDGSHQDQETHGNKESDPSSKKSNDSFVDAEIMDDEKK